MADVNPGSWAFSFWLMPGPWSANRMVLPWSRMETMISAKRAWKMCIRDSPYAPPRIPTGPLPRTRFRCEMCIRDSVQAFDGVHVVLDVLVRRGDLGTCEFGDLHLHGKAFDVEAGELAQIGHVVGELGVVAGNGKRAVGGRHVPVNQRHFVRCSLHQRLRGHRDRIGGCCRSPTGRAASAACATSGERSHGQRRSKRDGTQCACAVLHASCLHCFPFSLCCRTLRLALPRDHAAAYRY